MHNHFQSCRGDPCACDLRRYWVIFAIATGILTLEVIGGLISGSLALLSDAGHVFADSLGIVVAVVVEAKAMKNRDKGEIYRRNGAYILAALLFAIAGWVIWEAVGRFHSAEPVAAPIMLAVAVVGAIGNYYQHRINSRQDENLTSRGMRLHILSDLWQSVGVILAGALIWLTGQVVFDLAASILIACYMFYCAIKFLSSIQSH